MDQHIRSFSFHVSHYGKGRTKQRYLFSELSIRKTYVLFLKKHFSAAYFEVEAGTDPEKVECPVRHRSYLNYFKDQFNDGFWKTFFFFFFYFHFFLFYCSLHSCQGAS